MYWQGRNVLVTGGASFIGSHLVDALVDRIASVFEQPDLRGRVIANNLELVRQQEIHAPNATA